MTTGIALVDAREGDRGRVDPREDGARTVGPEGRQLIVVAALVSAFVVVLLVLLGTLQPVIATSAIIGVVAVFAAMLVVRTTVERARTRVRALTALLGVLIAGSVAAVLAVSAAEWLPA
ncbi:hypothetical protein [Agromyces mangrovi Wang et al. 2018]|uniref:hypothetical protein n=1 Tax=Agromyces mangrovi TaxID=1858653 RepID=UPI002572F463|nr:hypothetical protein [Agromyces mangrovi]BDZ64469.1 hypothetical protein GCM10025877_14070 [Agromyces mangrovi]